MDENELLNEIVGTAKDILAEEGTAHYELFIDKDALDRAYGILDEILTGMLDERESLNKAACG